MSELDCPKCKKSKLVIEEGHSWCPRRGCGYGLSGVEKRGAAEGENKNLPKFIKKQLTNRN